MTASPPIACTLSSGDYADRLALIGKLNRESLQSYRVEGLTLELVYEADAAIRVHDLIEREEKCCAFLHFSVVQTTDAIHVRIKAPPHAHDAASALFAPFLGDAPGVGSASV